MRRKQNYGERGLGLKTLLCATVLGIGVSVGHGQWLETRITLPDSLGGAIYPTCLTTDTSERYVYVGDWDEWKQNLKIFYV